jgi:hypothetical protein
LQSAACPPKRERRGTFDAHKAGMIDLLAIAASVGFFALSWGYARLCERL